MRVGSGPYRFACIPYIIDLEVRKKIYVKTLVCGEAKLQKICPSELDVMDHGLQVADGGLPVISVIKNFDHAADAADAGYVLKAERLIEGRHLFHFDLVFSDWVSQICYPVFARLCPCSRSSSAVVL